MSVCECVCAPESVFLHQVAGRWPARSGLVTQFRASECSCLCLCVQMDRPRFHVRRPKISRAIRTQQTHSSLLVFSYLQGPEKWPKGFLEAREPQPDLCRALAHQASYEEEEDQLDCNPDTFSLAAVLFSPSGILLSGCGRDARMAGPLIGW